LRGLEGVDPAPLRSVEGTREGRGVFVRMLKREVREGQGGENGVLCCGGE